MHGNKQDERRVLENKEVVPKSLRSAGRSKDHKVTNSKGVTGSNATEHPELKTKYPLRLNPENHPTN